MDNTNIRYGNKLYRQICGIPMGTNCAPLVADLLLFYESDFMTSLPTDNQADIIEAFNSQPICFFTLPSKINSTSRYLDDLLNIDNPYFEEIVNQIYKPELQFN